MDPYCYGFYMGYINLQPLTKEISIAEQIRCVKRELGFRKTVFPKRVGYGAMKQEDMDKEIAHMEAVLETLTGLEPTLFNQEEVKAIGIDPKDLPFEIDEEQHK